MKNLESQILRFVVELRKKKNIRSKTLANKINLRPENYSRLEKGKVRLDMDMLTRIAKVLNVKASYLVWGGERLSERKLQKEEDNPSLSHARLMMYDARKNIKDKRAIADKVAAGIVLYPRKVVEDKAIMEKLQETIVKLEKVIQSQEKMLQGQQQIILSQEEDKKQLWKLIDQIEGLKHFTIEKNA